MSLPILPTGPASTAYLVVAAITATATVSVAVADFIPAEFVLANSARVGVPRSWLPTLGALKLAGGVGLIAPLLGWPVIGVAAAAGLAAFFIGAVAAHVRARVFSNIAVPAGFLLLSATSLSLLLVVSR